MIENGTYEINAELKGGSGRASILSPSVLVVEDNRMQAQIEWSSSSYDYMEVDGKSYTPVNSQGNSIFIIDVPTLDTDLPIKAETTAMSQPHMIEYTLCFDSASMKEQGSVNTIIPVVGVLLVLSAAVVLILKRKYKNGNKNNKAESK